MSIIRQIHLNKVAMASIDLLDEIRSAMLFSVLPWVCAVLLPYRLSLRPFVLLGGNLNMFGTEFTHCHTRYAYNLANLPYHGHQPITLEQMRKIWLLFPDQHSYVIVWIFTTSRTLECIVLC